MQLVVRLRCRSAGTCKSASFWIFTGPQERHPSRGPYAYKEGCEDGEERGRYMRYPQRLNFGMKIKCCCSEQPISNQKIILTAISFGDHNNNIRFPSQNSASGYPALAPQVMQKAECGCGVPREDRKWRHARFRHLTSSCISS